MDHGYTITDIENIKTDQRLEGPAAEIADALISELRLRADSAQLLHDAKTVAEAADGMINWSAVERDNGYPGRAEAWAFSDQKNQVVGRINELLGKGYGDVD